MAGEGKLCDLFFVVVEHGSRPSLRKMGATEGWPGLLDKFLGCLAAMVACGLLGNMVTLNSFGEPRPARQTEAATVSPATGMSRVASTQVRWRDAERGYSRILL